MQTIKLTPYDNDLAGKFFSGGDIGILLDTTASGFTVTVPDANSTEGTKLTFTVIGNNNAIINPIKSQYINELNSITLAKNEIVSISAYKGRYYIFNKY
jgi:hypothetical protein